MHAWYGYRASGSSPRHRAFNMYDIQTAQLLSYLFPLSFHKDRSRSSRFFFQQEGDQI